MRRPLGSLLVLLAISSPYASDGLVARVGFGTIGAPQAPTSPNPPDGAIWVTLTPTLSWTSVDATSYEIRFGTANPPPTVVSNTTDWWYSTPPLNGGTKYFWQIVATNTGGATAGPIWNITTDPTGVPASTGPAVPGSPNPPNGASWVTVTPTLSWTSADATSYEIHFGTVNPPPTVVSNTADWWFSPPPLNGGTTYFWQIVAKNSTGTSVGPIWSFSTDPTAAPPLVISALSASSIARFGATITWTTNEPSDSEVEYGLTTAYGSFSTQDLNLVIAHSEALGGLNPGTLYHFRVRSRDAAGNLALSGDFTLTTLEGTPPSVSITAPVAGATVSGSVTVTANASDDVGVVGVQFQLDGLPLGGTVTTAPYSVGWNTSTATNGSHSLTAVAWDAAGNQTTSMAVAVIVSNIGGQVTLAWDLDTDPTVVGYKVYVGTASGVYTLNIDAGNVTTFTVTGLQSGTVYYFAVTAYDQFGNESVFSNEVSTILP